MPSGLLGWLEGRDLDIHQTRDDREKVEKSTVGAASAFSLGGIGGWMLRRLGRRPQTKPRLALVEQINLAPRQTLALVEAEGHRLLVATSQGAPSFYSLDEHPAPNRFAGTRNLSRYRRITW